MYQKHLVLDVDLKSFFDDIRHAPVLAKVARRVRDEQVLRLIKQFLKSTGARGIPQGSPLSPLLANVMLNDLDHILARGYGYLSYARYLDDMVVLTYDSRPPDIDRAQVVRFGLRPRRSPLALGPRLRPSPLAGHTASIE
jgi:retron-type reverse transcriptase